MTTRFVMVGGFLGSGKTTVIARLARHYMDRGLNVGIVTNDQAYDLVDTHSLRAMGFRVGEVPGACFCCKFNDLVAVAESLREEESPDVVIAEPVGSCTDLVATVVEPLRQLHGDQYEIAPLAVLLKPEHGRKILSDESGVGFSPKAAYIFLKQIEEADIVAVNKIDKLSQEDQEQLLQLAGQRFPGKTVLALSGRRGDGFEDFVAAIDAASPSHNKFMAVDYDVYAEGEAELGWLNCRVQLQSETGDKFGLDPMLLGLVQLLQKSLAGSGHEPAHLKVLGETASSTGIANLVDSATAAELSLESGATVEAAALIINARVAIDPEELEQAVRATLDELATEYKLEYAVEYMDRFRPGRPEPTHRAS